jgi:hypothetical protein
VIILVRKGIIIRGDEIPKEFEIDLRIAKLSALVGHDGEFLVENMRNSDE